MKTFFLLVSLIVGASWVVQARPLTQNFTSPVAEDNGDVVTSAQVVVSSFTPTLLDVGVSSNVYNVTLRRRIFKNMSSVFVYVGSNTTTLTTTGFQIDPTTGTYNNYQTYSVAPIYGTCGSPTGCTVGVLKEMSANP